ncbi:DUF3108 domain-containing protein [Roseomonas eburnea]|uniref:DUF3108 domain-containing protein n=1 Tax=Neoroseomonas eburnea TaxID=1346889 RepID=A0A9X9X976_9PROT|nr:DUF3108 domain-containing protein [Neoroseomonas eburnea]MBR0680262.1 DUF3108 domain-containing protein [Neoroseomonas eburnea]
MRRPSLAVLAIFAALAAEAARAEPLEADYALSQAGLAVMDLRIVIDVSGSRYRLSTVARSRGIGRLFLPREQISEAEGGLAGREVVPVRYRAEGEWRGTPRRTVLEYLGRTPRLAVLEPPEGPDRIPVRPEEADGTMDTLSALLRLSRDAAATGRCDLTGAVFDGRRRLEWSSRTLGTGAPPVPGFSGQALRCALESRLVAGFRRGDDPASAGQPRQAEAWIAQFGADRPPMPLRVEFPSTFLGSFRMDLVRVGPSAP